MKNSRKLVYGHGINDADYQVNQNIDGKIVRCKFYVAWQNMLGRVYSQKFHIRYPTYKNLTVCKDWLRFSNFKTWMVKQSWQGKELDKDIIKPGNKEYSPEYCCFVDHSLNNILVDSRAARGNHPIGVSYNKQAGKYVGYCSDGAGIKKHLGSFDTPGAAHAAYVRFKSNLIASIACKQSDRRISNGLMCHAALVSMKA